MTFRCSECNVTCKDNRKDQIIMSNKEEDNKNLTFI